MRLVKNQNVRIFYLLALEIGVDDGLDCIMKLLV
jgi:hypothetical protein